MDVVGKTPRWMRKAAEERWETEIPRVEMDIADEIRKAEETGLFSKLSLRVRPSYRFTFFAFLAETSSGRFFAYPENPR